MNSSETTDEMMRLASRTQQCRETAELRSLLKQAEVLFAAAWCELAQEVYSAQAGNRTLFDDWLAEQCATQQEGDVYEIDSLIDSVLDATPVGIAFKAVVATVWQRTTPGLPRRRA
jgi:hypothetical protein